MSAVGHGLTTPSRKDFESTITAQTGGARYEPLPQAQPGWNRSRVHRTMTSLFGSRPFTS